MGRRGPRKSSGGISEVGWSVKADQAMRDAMAHDLATLRKLNPRASRSDVVRLWARISTKSRYLAHVSDLEKRADQAERHLNAAAEQIHQQRQLLAGFQAKQRGLKHSEQARLARALAKAPAAVSLELEALIAAEAAGAAPVASLALLREAKSTFGSYAAAKAALGVIP